MNKKDIKQTILLSFIVAFILESYSFFRNIMSEYIGSLGSLLMLLMFGGIIMIASSGFSNLLEIKDKELIKLLQNWGMGIVFVSMVLLWVFSHFSTS
ncbi:hypothetical protein KAT36_01070 [Candidatus Pacearchaeota archaeon]|nr:hypothetical protein [Candidatus Pacearchaeota archaeon]